MWLISKVSPCGQATQESRNCGNNWSYQVAIIGDGEEYDQSHCKDCTQEKVRELVPSLGGAGVVLPYIILLYVRDNTGDMLRSDSLKDWIEGRCRKLRY